MPASAPAPHLAVHVLQSHAQLNEFQHELALGQQGAAPRLEQLFKVALLVGLPQGTQPGRTAGVRGTSRGQLVEEACMHCSGCWVRSGAGSGSRPRLPTAVALPLLGELMCSLPKAAAPYLTKLHRDVLDAAVLEAGMVLNDVRVVQRSQHAHLIPCLLWKKGGRAAHVPRHPDSRHVPANSCQQHQTRV